MTIKHAASLCFGGHREYAKKRLQRLKAARLIGERPRKQFDPSILFLRHRGLLMLRERGILELYPQFSMSTLLRRAQVSELTISHELAVVDLKVAFHAAAKAHDNLSVVEFNTWPRLNQFVVPDGIIKPDAFMRVRETRADGIIQEHAFYLELDRSTEPLGTLVTRARGYMAHRKRAGEPSIPFRVLYVLRLDGRRTNIALRLLTSTPPVLSLVSLATSADVKKDPFGAIWTRPLDYKAGSPTPSRLLRKLNPNRKKERAPRNSHVLPA